MILLLDTHLLLWAGGTPERLSPEARSMIADARNELWFSAASLWEISIKHGLGRRDFRVNPHVFRRALLGSGYSELVVTSQHAIATTHLPPIHKDPFDRILVAQAEAEGALLLTADELVAQYPGPVRRV
ncbi:MAG: type II toxin-antitoxin system VapC family toxin [Wenzhouxiangellaceae bacterium]